MFLKNRDTILPLMKKDYFVIKGLNGKKTLDGEVFINGAKNASLKAMAASILFESKVTLENMPDTADVNTMADILVGLGAKVTKTSSENGCVFEIDPTSIHSTDLNSKLAQGMRASIVLTGPLLSRYKQVSFPSPGGCVIGTRPIDLFIDGYNKMSAKYILDGETYKIYTDSVLQGGNIFFNIQSVGGTETLMMAAVLASGTTVLKNCAMEPEIVNVAEWLNACGAKIHGAGTSTIIIEGSGGKLLKPIQPYVSIPDRIEAGSFLLLGALCANNLTIKNCLPEHLESVTNLLKDSGVPLVISKDSIKIVNNANIANSSFKAFNIRTHEYPGFPTDLQSQMVTFLTQVSGESLVFETIFEGRFKFTEDLIKMGAKITTMNSREILIKGPALLSDITLDVDLRAHDIRAGFAIVMACLVGRGEFKISNAGLIDRGYERIENKLSAIGAYITRVTE
jgi:UDP-N-acetylglucosamine 1-carboxyvinyltransferase